MTSERWLAATTVVFGIVCTLIAARHVVMGPPAIFGSVPVNAIMDNEHRFFASLFLCFGIAVTWCGLDIRARAGPFRALLAAFFVGGIARVISVVAVGWPAALYIILGAIELALPLILGAWLARLPRPYDNA